MAVVSGMSVIYFIATHQNDDCPKRPFCCSFCKKYNSIFQDITEIHYGVCAKYLVTCPNKCQDNPFEQTKINDFLDPFTEVICPFVHAGCKTKLSHKDMPGHTAEISGYFLKKNSWQLLHKSWSRTREQIKKQFEERQIAMERQFKAALSRKTIVGSSREGNYSIQGRNMMNFKLTYGNRAIYLPHSYSHSHGSIMCIHVYSNGYSDGKGSHVSVFMCLMQGPFDDHLKWPLWPFRGDVNIQITNQAGDHSHIEETIQFDNKIPAKYCARVIGKDKVDNGWGYYRFLTHSNLEYIVAMKTQ